MKKIRYTALIAVAVSLLLAGCDSDDPVFPGVATAPPPTPLTWDQVNWDEVVWQ